MKKNIYLFVTFLYVFTSCNQKKNYDFEKNIVEKAAVSNTTKSLDSIFHINQISKLPDYSKVEIDSMKVISIIPLYGNNFREKLPKTDLDFDLKNIESIKKLEKHIDKYSDKSEPIKGYITVLTYNLSVIKNSSKELSDNEKREFLKIKNTLEGKKENIKYLTSDLKLGDIKNEL